MLAVNASTQGNRGLSVGGSSSCDRQYNSALLRMKDHLQTYGFIQHVDPYVDYIVVEFVVLEASDIWTGTMDELLDVWEPFLLTGAA